MFNIRALFSVTLISLTFVACGDDTDETNNTSTNNTSTNNTSTNNTSTNNTSTNNGAEVIEVVGEWATDFGFDEVITATTWGTQNIALFDNVTRVAITQNLDDAEFFPSKFDRIVWTPLQDNVFYYCTVVFGQDTAVLAQEAEGGADAMDLEEGCGGFPWTKMTRK